MLGADLRTARTDGLNYWRGRRRSESFTWMWAFLPLLTLGFATPATMLYAAVLRKHRLQTLSVVVYTIMVTIMFITPDGGVPDWLYSTALATNMLVGTGHSLTFRRWVFDLDGTRGTSLLDQQDAVLSEHATQAELRSRAREIVRENPALARSLCIGRPYLRQKEFPDGGLVDVNHVRADVISRATSLPLEVTRRIEDARNRQGGFVSVADISIALGLPPDYLDDVADQLIFLPMRRIEQWRRHRPRKPVQGVPRGYDG